MKNTVFTGAGVAIVTPFYPDGSINYDMFGKLIDFQIENKTDAIIVCGTTGESACLSCEEHSELLKFAVKKVNKRVPVIAGTGSNDTAYSIKLSHEAQEIGADALLCVTPFYNKTSQDGLVAHFTAIADSVDIPVILYNVPSRTGLNIKPETYKKLSKHPNIVAAKEANGDISSIAKTISLCGDDLDIYSGNDDQIAAIMALGGKGVISVFSNVMPRECHELTQAMLDGDYKKGVSMQLKYLELMNALFMDVSPIPVKAALKMMGMDCGIGRLPLVELSDSAHKTLYECMKKYSLAE